MTRIEKFKTLRTEIAKEIVENSFIWEAEKKLHSFQDQLIKIDKQYFANIITKINDSLNLLNLEKTMIRNNYQYIKEPTSFFIKKILADINNEMNTILCIKKDQEIDHTLIQFPIEYQTIIDNMRQKIIEFEKDLESKINNVNVFVKNLEKKHSKLTKFEPFDKTYEEIKIASNKLQEDYQQLRVRGKVNFKTSFISFSFMILALLIIVVLLILILMLK